MFARFETPIPLTSAMNHLTKIMTRILCMSESGKPRQTYGIIL